MYETRQGHAYLREVIRELYSVYQLAVHRIDLCYLTANIVSHVLCIVPGLCRFYSTVYSRVQLLSTPTTEIPLTIIHVEEIVLIPFFNHKIIFL